MAKIEAVEIDFMRRWLWIPCQDKIRMVQKDVVGVINNKQTDDSKYTVVWPCQRNDGNQNGFKKNQGSKMISNIAGIFYFPGDSGEGYN